MNKANMLLAFLQKNCRVTEPLPSSEGEQFDFYRHFINKLPKECINESFLKIEDMFLTENLKQKTIISVEKQIESMKLCDGEACEFSADAVLSFLNEGNDKSIYLYGGTRLKNAIAASLNDKDMSVTKANNVHYSGVISAVLPSVDTKLTSVILGKITEKYAFALDIARDNKLKALVLCLPNVQNTILCSRVADAIIGTIKQHEYFKNVKLVLLAPTNSVLSVYKSKLGV